MSWIYRKLFHDPLADGSATDTLLVRVVAVLMSDLIDRAAIDRFFFLRYAEGGPHVRLRVRVADGQDVAHVASRLDELGTDAALVSRLVHAEYEPEILKHGGPVGQDIAERQFFSSSRLALGCIARTLESPDARGMVAAWAAGQLLACAGIEGHDRRAFLQAYAAHWRTLARTMGLEIPELAPDEQACETVRAFTLDATRVSTLVGDASGFIASLEHDIGELVAADRAGKIQAPLPAILANLLHTAHNRLGMSIVDEVSLAGLLAAVGSTQRVRPAPGSGVAPHEAAARLVHSASQSRPGIAIVDGPSRTVPVVLTEAAVSAGLDVVCAMPGTKAAPYALLHAVADAHPAGAALHAALQRVHDTHAGPGCALPPDSEAVGEALRAFLVDETRTPTLLLLGVHTADADTLHALLFLARSIEGLPLAVVLVAGERPHDWWPSFVRELTIAPGFFRIQGDPGTLPAPDYPPQAPSARRGANYVRAGAIREGTTIIVEALARESLAPAAKAEALVILAQAMLRASRPTRAKEALQVAAALGLPAELRPRARRLLLAALHSLADFEGLEALHHDVVADAEAEGQSVAEQSWAMLDAALVSARPERRAEHEARLDALLALPVSEVPIQCRLAAHAWRAAAYVGRGEYEQALPHQRQALACATRVGDFSRALFLRARLASSVAVHGHPDEAEALFRATADAASWAGHWDIAALAAQHAVTLALARGDQSMATTWLLEPVATRRAVWTSPYGRLAVAYLHGKVAFAAGEVEAARSYIAQFQSQRAVTQDAMPENTALLDVLVARLEADLERRNGNTAAHHVATRSAAELELRLPPLERRLAAALTTGERGRASLAYEVGHE